MEKPALKMRAVVDLRVQAPRTPFSRVSLIPKATEITDGMLTPEDVRHMLRQGFIAQFEPAREAAAEAATPEQENVAGEHAA